MHRTKEGCSFINILAYIMLCYIYIKIYSQYITYDMPRSSYMNMTKSANILASLSETTEPCDDFFEFACENWIKAYPMPKGKL